MTTKKIRKFTPKEKFIQAIFGIILGYIVFVSVSILFTSKSKFLPKAIEEMISEVPTQTIDKDVLTLTTWNIGYGGLGKNNTFFFDNGNLFHSGSRQVRPKKKQYKKNFEGITNTLKGIASNSDIILLQEVDEDSKRSYGENQVEKLKSSLGDAFTSYFAPNFKVKRVPVPIIEQWNAIGKVNSGLLTSTRYASSSAERLQLPGQYPWPKHLFMLKRCLLVNRIPTKGGKELVLVHTHNSAFDGGKLKVEEMAFIKDFITKEYEKGNYVIAGGDWNQNPPGFSKARLKDWNTTEKLLKEDLTQNEIDFDYLPEGWTYPYDSTVPTNRSVDHPFDKNVNTFNIIDFFILSPNVTAQKVYGIDLDFEHSDHQPVTLQVRLK